MNEIILNFITTKKAIKTEQEKQIKSQSAPKINFDILTRLIEASYNETKSPEEEYTIGNYLIKKTLGQGTFGKVKLGIHIPDNTKVAIKILEKKRITEKSDMIRVKREFEMLSKFNHPNVISVSEIFESTNSFYTVMEYCEGGELFYYIVKNRRLSEKESACFYYQLINGLEYLHSLSIVHRDLKPENLLLTKNHLLKIIDFGLSNYFKNENDILATPCGSPSYASPEMVCGQKYNGFKIDIWSSGIILYAMLCGYLPFDDKNNKELFKKIQKCKINYPDFLSEISLSLLKKILVNNPDNRISLEEIKLHPFYLKGKEIFEKEFGNNCNKNINIEINQNDKKNDIKNEENNTEKNNDNNTFNNNKSKGKKEKNLNKKKKELILINIKKHPKNNISSKYKMILIKRSDQKKIHVNREDKQSKISKSKSKSKSKQKKITFKEYDNFFRHDSKSLSSKSHFETIIKKRIDKKLLNVNKKPLIQNYNSVTFRNNNLPNIFKNNELIKTVKAKTNLLKNPQRNTEAIFRKFQNNYSLNNKLTRTLPILPKNQKIPNNKKYLSNIKADISNYEQRLKTEDSNNNTERNISKTNNNNKSNIKKRSIILETHKYKRAKVTLSKCSRNNLSKNSSNKIKNKLSTLSNFSYINTPTMSFRNYATRLNINNQNKNKKNITTNNSVNKHNYLLSNNIKSTKNAPIYENIRIETEPAIQINENNFPKYNFVNKIINISKNYGKTSPTTPREKCVNLHKNSLNFSNNNKEDYSDNKLSKMNSINGIIKQNDEIIKPHIKMCLKIPSTKIKKTVATRNTIINFNIQSSDLTSSNLNNQIFNKVHLKKETNIDDKNHTKFNSMKLEGLYDNLIKNKQNLQRKKSVINSYNKQKEKYYSTRASSNKNSAKNSFNFLSISNSFKIDPKKKYS